MMRMKSEEEFGGTHSKWLPSMKKEGKRECKAVIPQGGVEPQGFQSRGKPPESLGEAFRTRMPMDYVLQDARRYERR
jgi:hypothetical protein